MPNPPLDDLALDSMEQQYREWADGTTALSLMARDNLRLVTEIRTLRALLHLSACHCLESKPLAQHEQRQTRANPR